MPQILFMRRGGVLLWWWAGGFSATGSNDLRYWSRDFLSIGKNVLFKDLLYLQAGFPVINCVRSEL